MMTWGKHRRVDRTHHKLGGKLLDRWGDIGIHWYEAGMRWSLAHPVIVSAMAVGLTVVTVFVTMKLPREILPRVDEGLAVAYLKLPEGTAIEETGRQTKRIEDAAKAL